MALITGHGNIKTYLFRYKIIESQLCSCEEGEQSVDHIIYECKLYENERDRLKAAVRLPENWPISRNKLCTNYYKNFKEFTNNIELDKVQCKIARHYKTDKELIMQMYR
jgi:hypothetical protein